MLPRIFVVMLLVILGCSPTAQEAGSYGGSEALGRYSPSLVQKNGHVKACFDRAELSAADREIIPQLNSKIYSELVERTRGVVNPFSKDERKLPWCDEGARYLIRIYLVDDFHSKAEQAAYKSAAQSKKEFPEFTGGIAQFNCAHVKSANTNDRDSIDFETGESLGQRCVVLYTRAVRDRPSSRTGDRILGRISFNLLHEMLHVYGFTHEYFHTGFASALNSQGKHQVACVNATRVAGTENDKNAVDSGKADLSSVMNYCSPAGGNGEGADYDKVRLSDGDVSLLLKLYGNGKAPTQNAARPAKTRTWESQTQSVAECSQFRANDVEFSQGWKTSYVLVEKNGAWEVTVTGVSRSDGRTEDWKTHPVGDATKADSKFATYIDQARRILEHRTPQGSVLKIEMVCQ